MEVNDSNGELNASGLLSQLKSRHESGECNELEHEQEIQMRQNHQKSMIEMDQKDAISKWNFKILSCKLVWMRQMCPTNVDYEAKKRHIIHLNNSDAESKSCIKMKMWVVKCRASSDTRQVWGKRLWTLRHRSMKETWVAKIEFINLIACIWCSGCKRAWQMQKSKTMSRDTMWIGMNQMVFKPFTND